MDHDQLMPCGVLDLPTDTTRRAFPVWVRGFLLILGLTTAIAIAPTSIAQTDTAELQTEFDETVRVRLVQMAVRARDRAGRPVADLTAEEIVVKDRGRKMRVAFLEPVTREYDQEDVRDVRLYVGAPGAAEAAVRSDGSERRFVILLIDVENDYRLLKQQAIDAAVRFVRNELGAGYRVAVFSYDGEIHLETNFTTNREELAAAVMRGYNRPARPRLDLQARTRGLLEQLESCAAGQGTGPRRGDESCLRGVMLEYADEVRPEADDYLEALDGLIRYAGGLQGHATVLALSHGVASDPTAELMEATRAVYGNTEQLATLRLEVGTGEGARVRMDRLLESALASKVTLHFIDRNPAPAGGIGARQGAMFEAGARPMQAAFTAPQADLQEMAAGTGGVFVHDSDVFAGLKRAMSLERGAYLLGYYVDRYVPPGRLSKVRINARRKGVRVLHRRGYYAGPPPSSSSTLGNLSLGVPLSLEEDGRQGQFLPFTIVADPRKLGYQVVDEEASANFTLHFRVAARDGRVFAETFHLINHAYPADLWQASQVEPVQIHGWAELPPGEYRLTAKLWNTMTGEGGELSQDWVVPPATE